MLEIPVERVYRDGERHCAEVRKFSGDNPDVLDGVMIKACVRSGPLKIACGRGVGVVVRPGLPRVGALLYRHRTPPPWRVSSLADYAIHATGPEGLRRHRDRTLAFLREEKPRVEAALRRCARYVPSAVHFYTVLGEPPPGVKTRPLRDKGIAGFRLSLKSPEANDLLLKALCLSKDARPD
jgi:hypothetical protein